MIDPSALLAHARRLAGAGPGRPPDVDLRRAVSAAYYALFHEVTRRAAAHLIGSASGAHQAAIRRTWTHGEIDAAAGRVVERARILGQNPQAPLPKDLKACGPLIDLAASDAHLVTSLKAFSTLQVQRHRADYDHSATFDKATLLTACQQADQAIGDLGAAAPVAREAFWSALTVDRRDFAVRG